MSETQVVASKHHKSWPLCTYIHSALATSTISTSFVIQWLTGIIWRWVNDSTRCIYQHPFGPLRTIVLEKWCCVYLLTFDIGVWVGKDCGLGPLSSNGGEGLGRSVSSHGWGMWKEWLFFFFVFLFVKSWFLECKLWYVWICTKRKTTTVVVVVYIVTRKSSVIKERTRIAEYRTQRKASGKLQRGLHSRIMLTLP
jgi:hypothetical protein